MNFTTQCGENRHTDIANFAKLIHIKKLIHCVAIFSILYGNYYPSHGEFKLTLYREIFHMDLSEFYSTVWEKTPKVSTKYILLCCIAIIAIFL